MEVGIGFAGEADDHGGADGDAGDGLADSFEEFEELIAVGAALHAFEDFAGGVLERHVDVFDERFVGGDGIEQFLGDAVGVAVEEADPLFVFGFDLGEAFQ